MQRKAELQRYTPLENHTELKRTPMPPSRPKPAVPTARRKTLADRSEGLCEMALEGCTGVATDASHRIKRGAGGRFGEAAVENNRLSNLLHACRTCHDWCHGNPDAAYELGLILKEGKDPLSEPANTGRYGPVQFDDDGGLWPIGGA